MGFLRIMTTRVVLTVCHSPCSFLRLDNGSYIALYSIICFCWNWIHFNQLNWVILHLISDVLIYLRCHIFRCSTSFRSITYLYEVFKVHIERVSFFVEVCPMRFDIAESQWAWVDSNHRPHAYQACALTGWAISPFQSGNHLLSHTVTSIVSSAAFVLTIVFGMWTGVSQKRIATGSIEHLARFFRA